MEGTNQLPENVSRKYDPAITPTTVHLSNGTVINMRTMSIDQADVLHKHKPGKYLTLKKEAAAEAKAKAAQEK